MIARADVIRLCERPPTPDNPVLSVHLDVDQSQARNLNREFVTVLKTHVRALDQRLPDPARRAFRADAVRVERFVADYAPRTTTLVLFADDSADLFWTGEVRSTLPTTVRWEPTPDVRPLLEAFAAHPRYAVALADKERARVLSVFLGEVEDERETLAAAEVRHKKASGTDHWRSQMHFQRQDEAHVRSHLARVVEVLETVARTNSGFEHLVLAGPVEATSELARLLPHPLADRVAGTVRLPVDTPADEVRVRTLPVVETARREADRALVDHVLDRGAVGLEATLRALQEGRLGALVHADGFAPRGGECLRCGALLPASAGEICAYCNDWLLAVDDLVGRVLARAATTDATIRKAHGETAARLLDAGGIGAVLRF
jgi:peptide chain release factor subunit 1